MRDEKLIREVREGELQFALEKAWAELDDCNRENNVYEAEIHRLQDERDRLRAAIKLFANPLNWHSDGYHVEWLLENEPWEQARRALAEGK